MVVKEINPNDVKWQLVEGIMLITGKGKIQGGIGANSAKFPWSDFKDDVTHILIDEGITEIGTNAFRDFKNLESVNLPSSLKRIHSYAFYNCVKLSDIRSRQNFHYIYDQSFFYRWETIIFGVDAFYNTPWGKSRFGDFYIANNQLFITYSDSTDIVIPEGVRELKSFSLSNLEVNSIVLPSTLETIEDFAFLHTKVKKAMELPDSIKNLTDHSLHDCSIKWIEHPLLIEVINKNLELDPKQKNRIPKLWKPYGLRSLPRKRLGNAKQIKVVKKMPPSKKDGYQSFVILNNNIVKVGRMIIAKAMEWYVLIGMTYNEKNELEIVRVYPYDRSYLVDLSAFEKESLDILKQFEETSLFDIPMDCEGKELYENDCLRITADGIKEEWFAVDFIHYDFSLEKCVGVFVYKYFKTHPEIWIKS